MSTVPALSERQMEILTLMASGLDQPAVARKLWLGLNTVYFHTKLIRRYFGVTTTQAAIDKARQWGLLEEAA